MRVFIADGAERTSLAIARSLGKRGIEVHCGECYSLSTTSLSKYCKKNFIYPDPQIDCNNFINWLIGLVRNGDYDVVYSSREVTTIPIVYYKKELEKYVKVPFPDYEKLQMTHDKNRTFKFAVECGISTPKTYFVENMKELEEMSYSIEYPVVVKSRYKTIWHCGKPIMLKVTAKNYIYNKIELMKISNDIFKKSGKMPLIQEYITGIGYGAEVLFNRGKLRTIFMHKRLREYPISGGASTLRESIYDENIRKDALDLMRNLKWHGVAMVEFKIDEKDKKPKLIEINGRFWGSLPLSIASGIDFPYMLHKMITEGDVESVFQYNIGVKCRWLIPGDILWLNASLKNRKDKMNVVREFFKFNGIKDDILSKEDFMPTIGALRVVMHQMNDVVRGRRNINGEVRRRDE